MNKTSKIIISVVLFIVLAVGITFQLVSDKIKPEEIRKVAISVLNESLPGAVHSIGKVDYNLGLSVKLSIDDLQMKLKNNNEKLASLGNIEVRIPILSILLGGGTIDVLVDKPEVYYSEYKNSNNWKVALPVKDVSKKKVKKEETGKSDEKVNVSLPSFVEKSKVNVRVKDVLLNYKNVSGQLSVLRVNRLLIKNLNLKKSTAFEIVTAIKHEVSKDSFAKVNVQIVGDINLANYLRNKKLSASIVTQLTEIELPGPKLNIPKLEIKSNVEVDKDMMIFADMSLKLGTALSITNGFKLQENKIKISKLNFILNFNSALSILEGEVKQLLVGLDLSDSSFNVGGDIDFNLDRMALNPKLNFSVTKPVILKANNGLDIKTTLNGSFEEKNYRLTLRNELLSGSVITSINGKLDVMNLPSELYQYPAIGVNVDIADIKLTKDFLQSTLYSSKSEKAAPTNTDNKEALENQTTDNETKILLPKIAIKIDGKNNLFAKENLLIGGNINIFKNNISSKDFRLKIGSGTTKVAFDTILKSSKNIVTNFNLNLDQIQMKAFNAILPPVLSGVSGLFNGKINGTLSIGNELKYSIDSNLKATNGELKDLKVKELVASFFASLKDKFPKGYEKYSEKFDTIEVKVNSNEKNNKIAKFKMVGNAQSSKLSFSGNVAMLENSSSKLTGTIFVKDVKNQLEEQFGTSDLPLKMEGKGFVLLPDIGYTLGKLASFAAKKQLSQAKKKVEKKYIKKVEKKIKKEAEKKLKKLFKGFSL